jgi:hypothetical protein
MLIGRALTLREKKRERQRALPRWGGLGAATFQERQSPKTKDTQEIRMDPQASLHALGLPETALLRGAMKPPTKQQTEVP